MMPATTASLTKDMRQLGHRTSLLFLFVSIFALTVRRLIRRIHCSFSLADAALRLDTGHPDLRRDSEPRPVLQELPL